MGTALTPAPGEPGPARVVLLDDTVHTVARPWRETGCGLNICGGVIAVAGRIAGVSCADCLGEAS